MTNSPHTRHSSEAPRRSAAELLIERPGQWLDVAGVPHQSSLNTPTTRPEELRRVGVDRLESGVLGLQADPVPSR